MNLNELDDTEDTEHTPQERAAAASRSTWVSVVVNLVLSTVQIVVGVWAKSQSLIADGIHSLSDLVADFVVLFANHHSQKDADEDHPYGHQRFETAASLVLGLLLLAVGVGMVWSAVVKLENPESVPQVHSVALWVAGGALVGKELLFGFMVGKMGWEFGWDAMHDLMDRAVDEQEVQAIRQTLLDTPGVAGVHDVRTRKMGDMVVADAHLEVDAQITVEEGHDIAVEARQRVMQRHRVLNLMTHVDPWRKPDRDHTVQPK